MRDIRMRIHESCKVIVIVSDTKTYDAEIYSIDTTKIRIQFRTNEILLNNIKNVKLSLQGCGCKYITNTTELKLENEEKLIFSVEDIELTNDNRRNYKRVDLVQDCVLSSLDSLGKEMRGKLIDISLGGAKIVVLKEISKAGTYHLKVEIGESRLKLLCNIVDAYVKDDKLIVVHVKFVDLNKQDENTLSRELNNIQLERIRLSKKRG